MQEIDGTNGAVPSAQGRSRELIRKHVTLKPHGFEPDFVSERVSSYPLSSDPRVSQTLYVQSSLELADKAFLSEHPALYRILENKLD